jgi:hypothetical protein
MKRRKLVESLGGLGQINGNTQTETRRTEEKTPRRKQSGLEQVEHHHLAHMVTIPRGSELVKMRVEIKKLLRCGINENSKT